ncbi:MAG: hypothetical protein ABIJ56_02580 [Pseudomonadota bacterium]
MKKNRFGNLVVCMIVSVFMLTCEHGGSENPEQQALAAQQEALKQAAPGEPMIVVDYGRADPGDREVDPGLLGDCRLGADYPCGTCDPACRTEGLLDPATDPEAIKDGLSPNPDGPGVILGRDLIDAAYAWISHYNIGQVSKMDLRSGDCIARYRVGIWGTSADSPSRSTVDGNGNAYIANRAYSRTGSVTKIAGDQRFCNKGGDGILQTSTSCSNVLALGADECVLWNKQLPEAGTCGDGSMRGMVVDFGDDAHREGYPWGGSTCSPYKFFRLNPDNGAVLDTVQINIPPYGASMDSEGWIWSTCWGCGDGAIQAFHSQTKVVASTISKPYSPCGPGWGYGITVDLHDRIWVGSWYNSSGRPCRFDPLTSTWFSPPGTAMNCAGHRGIAVDFEGDMWSACWQYGRVWRFDSDTGGDQQSYSVGCNPLGVGGDPFGKIWIANASCQRATRIDPATGSWETFTTGSEASYTYSDFTGMQRALRNPTGYWHRVFERCDATPMDKWGEVSWDITTPSNSVVTIFGRSADDEADLATAPEVTLAIVPPSAPPKDLEPLFSDARVYLGKYLKITVTMEQSTDGQSPVFVGLYTTYKCY